MLEAVSNRNQLTAAARPQAAARLAVTALEAG
jgi:hypothetical protein